MNNEINNDRCPSNECMMLICHCYCSTLLLCIYCSLHSFAQRSECGLLCCPQEYGNKVRQIIYPLLYSVLGVPSLLLLPRVILQLHTFTLYELRKEKRFTSIDLVEGGRAQYEHQWEQWR